MDVQLKQRVNFTLVSNWVEFRSEVGLGKKQCNSTFLSVQKGLSNGFFYVFALPSSYIRNALVTQTHPDKRSHITAPVLIRFINVMHPHWKHEHIKGDTALPTLKLGIIKQSFQNFSFTTKVICIFVIKLVSKSILLLIYFRDASKSKSSCFTSHQVINKIMLKAKLIEGELLQSSHSK